MRRSSFNTSASSGVSASGIFRATVVSVGDDNLLRVKIPKLGLNNVYEGVPYAGPAPAAGDIVFVGFLEGKSGSFVAFTGVAYEGNTGDPAGDITSVVAGTNLNGGGSSGTVTVNLESDITLTSVTADDFYGDLHGAIHILVKNVSGGSLTKGTPVYATGAVGASGAVEVEASLAGTGSTMPAMGLLDQDLANNGEGDVVVSGVLQNIDTDTPGYSVGDELYVAVSGGLTTTRPSGSSELVQKIGKVIRVQQQTGEILVQGAGRTNDVPNNIVAGGLTIDTDTLYVDATNDRVGIGTTSPVAGLHIEGFGDVSNSSTGHYLQMGATSGANIRIDDNEINAVNNGSAGTLYLQNDGGTLKVGNNSTTNMTVSGTLTSDSYRWGGTDYLTSTTTSALESELLARDVFDSSFSAFKTGWSYAGNGDLTDAGRLTELAGTSWLTWTDNSADNTLGNYTALVIAPTTGGSAGGVFVYNDQGSSYSPGWRELWNSSRTIVGPDGSAGAPAYSFADDTNTGMYSDGSDSISFATGGTQRLDIDGGGIKGKVSFSGPAGSAGTPGFNFDGDTNTGMYRVTTDQVGFSAGGTLKGRFWSQGLLMGSASTGNAQIGTGTGSAGAPVYQFYNDTNTGMYRVGSDRLGFTTGGAARMYVQNSSTGLTGASGRGVSIRTTGATEIYRQATGAADGILALYSNNGSTADLQWLVYGDGDTASDTGVYGTISDNRLKTNIAAYKDPTDDLMAINVIKYDLSKTSTGVDDNGDPIIEDLDTAKTMTGWDAQQVQSVKPGFVKLDAERGILSVKSSVFVPLLHRGFQVHEEKIAALEARIAALEAQ